VLAPLSELYGRAALYHTSNIGFLASTVACALAPNLESLIVFRFLAGSAGAAPLAIGGGTIADLIPIEQRGWVISIYFMGPLMGPILGPIAGGYLTQALGWRCKSFREDSSPFVETIEI
jgi:MFS family permease